jgi:hypothetical protein
MLYTPEIISQICGTGEAWEIFKSQSPVMDTQHERDSNVVQKFFHYAHERVRVNKFGVTMLKTGNL